MTENCSMNMGTFESDKFLRSAEDNANALEISNEKFLILMNRFSGLAPYSHEFVPEDIEPQILSGFVSAMTSFMGEVTGTTETHWKTAYGPDSVFLVEPGEWIVGVLATSRETGAARSNLRRVVREFEESFEFLKNADGINGGLFVEFDKFVRRVFIDERVTNRSIVTKRPDWRGNSTGYENPRATYLITKLLLNLSGPQTIEEVAESQDLEVEEVKELVSMACWHHAVHILHVPSNNDLLALSEKASTVLLSRVNPLQLTPVTLKVIAQLDGRTPLTFLTNEIPDQESECLFNELGTLINMGYIQRISLEKRIVLANECVLTRLVSAGTRIMGSRMTKRIFNLVSDQGLVTHPWVGRVSLTDRMTAMCILDESMTPDDLDDMCDTLEFMIMEFSGHMSRVCRTEEVD